MSRAERKESRLDMARAIRKQEEAGEPERIAETAKGKKHSKRPGESGWRSHKKAG